MQAPAAKFLDIILYSREQLLKEYEALPYAEGNAEVSLSSLYAGGWGLRWLDNKADFAVTGPG